jgi:hypothetical protein
MLSWRKHLQRRQHLLGARGAVLARLELPRGLGTLDLGSPL